MNLSRRAVLSSVVIGLAWGAGAAEHAKTDDARKVVVFDPKALGYVNCRIPGLVVTGKGTLLAYCEARRNKGGDWDPIDIVMRRSADGGATWGDVQKIAGGGEAKTYNNPVAIVDKDPAVPGGAPAVHFLYCTDYARCYYARSDDDGATFSKPVEITSAFEAFKKDYHWNVIATGPTHGIQLRTGRLLVPVWLSTGGKSHHPSVVATVYSDDRGATWKAGAIAIPDTKDCPNPNETVAAELSDGRVMLNARNESAKQRRVVVTGPDGASNWSAPAFDDALVEPICNGSIVRVPAAKAGERPAILFANPDNGDTSAGRAGKPGLGKWLARKNVTVRLSADDGKTWSAKRSIEPGPSGYSDLAVDATGKVHCLFERAGGLTLASFDVAWVTR
ncbi:MAG TPA: sialidase family protein [Tepidisphaeraceae bacterium]|nr:sialidase family protein [Tepidisphaeraceae bacterium]